MMARMGERDSWLDSRDFARIARAIAYIDEHYQSQPRLAQIAAAARLSEFHFNRLFRRWAGVTPKQYLAFVTARAARAALARTPSVLEAAYALGLSGPGRLHDLLVTLEGVTPGQVKALGRDLTLTFGFSGTPFGTALFASTARGLTQLSFVEPGAEARAVAALRAAWPRAALSERDAMAREFATRIWGAAAGPQAPALRLHLLGTNFQLRVWQALLERGAQGPMSYSALARAAGVAGGARAVGNALAANPVAWLIPCHSVLRKDGESGGYRWGRERKRAILAWEALRRGPGQARTAAVAAT
jgi:AraC family transcriptional regulator, regulatory protein of adaptative response / methylated-DNA-[protein]-cysteine methyltransferase